MPEILTISSMPLSEVPDYDDDVVRRPAYATVREIDFKLSDDGMDLIFFFSRADFEVPVNHNLPLLLTDIRDNVFGYGDNDKTDPKPPYDSPLSLGNKQYRYVIYRLTRNKRWQFARDFAPFSLGETAAGAKRYFEARRFGPDDELEKVAKGRPQRDECIVAYFIADNENYGDFDGHLINIHVDLLYKGTKRRLPIVIDPDIRHPGGSGP